MYTYLISYFMNIMNRDVYSRMLIVPHGKNNFSEIISKNKYKYLKI